MRAAARSADRRLAVQPEQPDRAAGAGRLDRRRSSTGIAADAERRRPERTDRRPRRGVRRVRRRDASSSSGGRTRTSSSSGPRARPTPLPGSGWGSRWRGPRRSPGSLRTVRPAPSPRSASRVVTAALADPRADGRERRPGRSRARSAGRRAARRRLGGRPDGDELPARRRSRRPSGPRLSPPACFDAASCPGRSGRATRWLTPSGSRSAIDPATTA